MTDLHHRPLRLAVTPGQGASLIVPSLPCPVALHARLPLPGYGYCWLTADNAGAGYSGGKISLLQEIWCSQLARVARRSDLYQLPADTNEAQRDWDSGQQLAVLAGLVIAGENLELTYARDQLREVHRLKSRKPAISSTLFQCGPSWPSLNPVEKPNILRPRMEMDQIAAVADSTVLPNFWGWVECQRGHYQWQQLDTIAEYARSHSISLKSFAICWGGSLPPWFRELDFNRQLEAIEQWATALIIRYGAQVEIWETVNEMHDWAFANPCRWSHEQALLITRLVSEIVGSLAPGKPRVINNCLVWGEYATVPDRGGPWTPFTFLETVIEQDIPFEGIGLQWIYRVGGQENRDLLECTLHMERFKALDKQLYLTEVGAPSDPRPRRMPQDAVVDVMVGWRGTWSPNTQADWLEALYTIAAGQDVVFINWWDFNDTNSFIVNGGMKNEEGQLKPVYSRWDAICSRYGWGKYNLLRGEQ